MGTRSFPGLKTAGA